MCLKGLIGRGFVIWCWVEVYWWGWCMVDVFGGGKMRFMWFVRVCSFGRCFLIFIVCIWLGWWLFWVGIGFLLFGGCLFVSIVKFVGWCVCVCFEWVWVIGESWEMFGCCCISVCRGYGGRFVGVVVGFWVGFGEWSFWCVVGECVGVCYVGGSGDENVLINVIWILKYGEMCVIYFFWCVIIFFVFVFKNFLFVCFLWWYIIIFL